MLHIKLLSKLHTHKHQLRDRDQDVVHHPIQPPYLIPYLVFLHLSGLGSSLNHCRHFRVLELNCLRQRRLAPPEKWGTPRFREYGGTPDHHLILHDGNPVLQQVYCMDHSLINLPNYF